MTVSSVSTSSIKVVEEDVDAPTIQNVDVINDTNGNTSKVRFYV